MEHPKLIDIVRRPLSPDTEVEAAGTREEYDQVREILEDEGARYPQLLYDSARKVAIVVAAPSPLHGGMAGEVVAQIRDEVMRNQGRDVTRGIFTMTDTTITKPTNYGLTTRAWDNALTYTENGHNTRMIAVEIAVSQSYESLRAAISWSVCALKCRIGIAMSINELRRGEPPSPIYYDSVQDVNIAVEEIERDLHLQLRQRPYGPLENSGVTWFGRAESVVLETFRHPDEDCAQETLLHPTQSFTLVRRGEFVGLDIPLDLGELVLGDCIPSHILSDGQVEAIPVNFFHRDWFESKFSDAYVADRSGTRDELAIATASVKPEYVSVRSVAVTAS